MRMENQFFSAREVPEYLKKISLGTDLMQGNEQHTLHTTGPPTRTTIVMPRDRVLTERRKFGCITEPHTQPAHSEMQW